MGPHARTTTEVIALTLSGLGVRLSADSLTTRMALYEWDAESERWHCLQNGLSVAHCTNDKQQGMRWNRQARRFERCNCATCAP